MTGEHWVVFRTQVSAFFALHTLPKPAAGLRVIAECDRDGKTLLVRFTFHATRKLHHVGQPGELR